MIAFCGPVIAEFGWEVITIQSYFRALSRSFDRTIVCSFPEVKFLYDDFCDEFVPHRHRGRALNWWSQESLASVEFYIPQGVTHHIRAPHDYRSEAREFIPYGVDAPISTYDYLIHARNIRKGALKNYTFEKWQAVVAGLDGLVASIGRDPDWHVPGTDDLRCLHLDLLTRYMAGARCVIGGSSGVMHLATVCKAPVVVWGDSKTYFNETLEVRYKKTWNPFGSPVSFLFDEVWKPEPADVLKAISGIERRRDENGNYLQS